MGMGRTKGKEKGENPILMGILGLGSREWIPDKTQKNPKIPGVWEAPKEFPAFEFPSGILFSTKKLKFPHFFPALPRKLGIFKYIKYI